MLDAPLALARVEEVGRLVGLAEGHVSLAQPPYALLGYDVVEVDVPALGQGAQCASSGGVAEHGLVQLALGDDDAVQLVAEGGRLVRVAALLPLDAGRVEARRRLCAEECLPLAQIGAVGEAAPRVVEELVDELVAVLVLLAQLALALQALLPRQVVRARLQLGDSVPLPLGRDARGALLPQLILEEQLIIAQPHSLADGKQRGGYRHCRQHAGQAQQSTAGGGVRCCSPTPFWTLGRWRRLDGPFLPLLHSRTSTAADRLTHCAEGDRAERGVSRPAARAPPSGSTPEGRKDGTHGLRSSGNPKLSAYNTRGSADSTQGYLLVLVVLL